MFYVNAYERTQHYGGPEEGGWWYSVYKAVDCLGSSPDQDAAHKLLGKVRQELAAQATERHDYVVLPGYEDHPDGNAGVEIHFQDLVVFLEDHPAMDHSNYPEGGWS